MTQNIGKWHKKIIEIKQSYLAKFSNSKVAENEQQFFRLENKVWLNRPRSSTGAYFSSI